MSAVAAFMGASTAAGLLVVAALLAVPQLQGTIRKAAPALPTWVPTVVAVVVFWTGVTMMGSAPARTDVPSTAEVAGEPAPEAATDQVSKEGIFATWVAISLADRPCAEATVALGETVKGLSNGRRSVPDAYRGAESALAECQKAEYIIGVLKPPAKLDFSVRTDFVNALSICQAVARHRVDGLKKVRRILNGDGRPSLMVTDAFASLVAESPELVELYAHGAELDRLIGEVACQPGAAENGRVRIPPSLYPALVERLKSTPLDEGLKSFLGASCEKAFLALVLHARPDILEWAAERDVHRHGGRCFSGLKRLEREVE